MRKYFALFLCALFLLTPMTVRADWPVYEEDIRADTICVMEAETGVILFDREMDAPIYPASVTKILTTLVALENGNLEDQVTMSEEACVYVASDSSNLNCQVGEVFTLEQLLYGVMIKSANEMATQVAIHVGGSVDHFCEMMNTRAADLGCTGTHFVNANGMPDEAHVTTAHDMALVMREAIKNDEFVKIIGTHSYTIPGTAFSEPRSFSSHNSLLVAPDYALPGIIGGKTGFTNSALHTLVNAARRDDMTLIVATFRTADPARVVEDQIALFNFFFDNYEKVETKMSPYAQGNTKILLPKGANPDEVKEEMQAAADGAADDLIQFHYSYDGKAAGTLYVPASSYDEYLKEQEAKETAEAEQTTSETEETSPEEDAERLATRQSARDYAARQFYLLVGAVGFVCLMLLVTIITLLVKIVLAIRANKRRSA